MKQEWLRAKEIICLLLFCRANIANIIFEYHEDSMIVLLLGGTIADYGQELLAHHC